MSQVISFLKNLILIFNDNIIPLKQLIEKVIL